MLPYIAYMDPMGYDWEVMTRQLIVLFFWCPI